MCVDTRYYETYNRDNVTLVDIRRAPIEAITPKGVRTTDAGYALDSIVFATGFDAMTGALLSIDIRGRGGRTLRDAWAEGPRTYLGLDRGRLSESLHDHRPRQPVGAQQHDRVHRAARRLDRRLHRPHARARAGTIEATAAAQEAWVGHVNEVGHATLYPRANSWYMGANIPGKPRIFMPYVGGVWTYRQICDDIAAKGYEGFTLTKR